MTRLATEFILAPVNVTRLCETKLWRDGAIQIPTKENTRYKKKRLIKVWLAIAALAVVTIVAFSYANISTLQGSLYLDGYSGFLDSGSYTGPATVQIQELTLNPDDATPWQYHDGLAYLVLTKGTLTEVEGCGRPTEDFSAGSGFVETPGTVHRVINNGNGAVVFTWAVMYPGDVAHQAIEVQSGPSCGS